MFTQFLSGFGGKLGERWLATVFTPAFLYWAGAALTLAARGLWPEAEKFGAGLSEYAKIACLIGALAVVVLSSAGVRALESWALEILQGYWLHETALGHWLVTRQDAKLQRATERFAELKRETAPSFAGQRELAKLERLLHAAPGNPADRVPVRLGNLVQAASSRVKAKYGLGINECWPRLWLLLPEPARKDLEAARSKLSGGVRAWVWSLLFVLWALPCWWTGETWSWWHLWPAGASAVGMMLACGSMLRSAAVYADLVESAFDVYRGELYKHLRWPPPANASIEPAEGDRITHYLWRGNHDAAIRFVAPGR